MGSTTSETPLKDGDIECEGSLRVMVNLKLCSFHVVVLRGVVRRFVLRLAIVRLLVFRLLFFASPRSTLGSHIECAVVPVGIYHHLVGSLLRELPWRELG